MSTEFASETTQEFVHDITESSNDLRARRCKESDLSQGNEVLTNTDY